MRALLMSLTLLLLGAACGGGESKTYDTYQACFDDVLKQGKTNVETIVECCIDKEIGGMKGPLCGADEPACINFLTSNIRQTDADITVKQQACQSYVVEKAMQ
ncbi:MAG: hypothetical protein M4D80_16390 [Myxococcota bacterium]|nr:hypothetical protein [Myxococcota bacterium]